MMQEDHIPAPLAHRPNLETIAQTDDTITVVEAANPNGYLTSDTVVKVKQ